VKFLSINSSSSSLHHAQQQPQNSPGSQAPLQTNLAPHLRQTNIAPAAANVPAYPQTFQAQPQPQLHQQWYSGIAAPQASHPATIPQPPVTQSQSERTPPAVKVDQWDEVYLGVLHSQDPTKLRDLLSRTNPDVVLPVNGTPLVSQAVILTLVHRVSVPTFFLYLIN
jgi:hypothetical protein